MPVPDSGTPAVKLLELLHQARLQLVKESGSKTLCAGPAD